jgi:hypothetical protein
MQRCFGAFNRGVVLAPRTVAAHLEHILVKLEASSRTLAAVRASREGLYVPAGASRDQPRQHDGTAR